MTNCKNCGAVMQYTKKDYGKVYKCEYCGTEHHIDELGRIEEYKIKFLWQGKLVSAYLSEIRCDYPPLNRYMLANGMIKTSREINPMITFTFVSLDIKPVEKI